MSNQFKQIQEKTNSLINFIVPNSIRFRFDDTCRANGRTRTSVLVELMDHYVLSESQNLARKIVELEHADEILKKARLRHEIGRSPVFGTDWNRDPVSWRSNRHPEPFFFGISDGREDV